MTLSQRLAENFHPHVRLRGESYTVRIRYGSIDQLEASVRVGQQSYEVDLGYEDGVLSAWCDCEEFVEVGPCAHLWAVLEKAGERGYLSAARFAPELILDWGEPDFDYDEADLDVFPFPPATPAGSAWRSQIAGIVSRAAYQPSVWPEKRQIVYLVDPGENIVEPDLDLAICTRDRKVDGKWGKPAALSLNRTAISTLPDAEDREIVSALASVQPMYGWNNLSSAIPARQSLTFPFSRTVLLMAMATGRCFLGNPVEPEAWQQLSWDEADPWQFRLEMRKKPGGGWSAVPVWCAERNESTSPRYP